MPQVLLYLDPEQLFEELCVDVCEQVVGKVQLGQEVQAREALWTQAVIQQNNTRSHGNTRQRLYVEEAVITIIIDE